MTHAPNVEWNQASRSRASVPCTSTAARRTQRSSIARHPPSRAPATAGMGVGDRAAEPVMRSGRPCGIGWGCVYVVARPVERAAHHAPVASRQTSRSLTPSHWISCLLSLTASAVSRHASRHCAAHLQAAEGRFQSLTACRGLSAGWSCMQAAPGADAPAVGISLYNRTRA